MFRASNVQHTIYIYIYIHKNDTIRALMTSVGTCWARPILVCVCLEENFAFKPSNRYAFS